MTGTCCAEVLKNLLWDGGLKDLANACWHKKDVTQWQDIHNLLLALHEVLMTKACSAFCDTHHTHCSEFSGAEFWKWLYVVKSTRNCALVSGLKYWCTMWVTTLPYALVIGTSGLSLLQSSVSCFCIEPPPYLLSIHSRSVCITFLKSYTLTVV